MPFCNILYGFNFPYFNQCQNNFCCHAIKGNQDDFVKEKVTFLCDSSI